MEKERPGYNCAKEVIDALLDIDNSLPAEEKLYPEVLQAWIEEIRDYADTIAVEYLSGKRSEDKITEIEMKDLYDKATLKLAQEVLDSLVDKDLVEVSVNDHGELLYGLTDKGRDTLKNSR